MARGTWGGGGDPSVFRVNVLFLLGASKCQWSFKLRDVGIQDNDAQEVAVQCRTVLADNFRALIRTGDSLVGFDVLKLGTDEGGWAPQTVQAGTYGVAGEASVPDYTCVNVALKSEIRKRYGQGRFFLPMLMDENITGNVLATSGVTRIQTFLDVMIANFTGDPVTHDLILVNAHPLLPARGTVGGSGYRPTIPASWYDVVSLRINSLLTMLRSRKAGVGS